MAATNSPAIASQEQRQILSRAAQLLASAADFEEALRQGIAVCLPGLGDFGFFDAVVGQGKVRRTAAAHQAPDIEALLAPTGWVKQVHPELNLCAMSTGEPALHADTDDAWYRRIAANEGHLAMLRQLAFRSMITVPMRYRGEVLGALTLFMGRSGRRHGPADLEFAGELANLAAPLVVNARLLAGERLARAESEAARRRMELLASAGAVLAHSLDPQKTLEAIAHTIVPGIADWCRIDLMDEAGVLQRGLAYHTDPARAEKALRMARELRAAPTTQGALAWVIKHRRAYYGRFDSPEALADPQLKLYTQTFGMKTHYMLPLLARGRVVGAMGVIQAESDRDLDEGDRALIEELARRAALALDNARLFAEAESARRQAESANRAKDEFLAMLGHELRNPLAPIATTLELMARRSPGTAIEERRVIGRQVAHLSRLIDDLLDISRITQGKVQLRSKALDMKTVVANALELTRPVFEQHARPVQVRIAPQATPVLGDPVRLAQVLCNLLVNAAKFTPPQGQVSLELRTLDDQIEVSVSDTGCGISPELLPQVFNLFVQGHQTLARQAGGLGLGLTIVRSLVEMHGGEVSAHSGGPGKGSTFTVRLPLRDTDDDATVPGRRTAPAPVGGGRILVVDDNNDAAETLADLLRMSGFEAQTAGDAKAALAVLDTFRPQLALLDIGLPEVDGYQLAAMIRQHPDTAALKLVALTGYGRDKDRARALEARFDEHLVKPVDVEQLLQVIGQLLRR